MTSLVTGRTGFVMSVLVRHWLEMYPAEHVVALDVAPMDAAAQRTLLRAFRGPADHDRGRCHRGPGADRGDVGRLKPRSTRWAWLWNATRRPLPQLPPAHSRSLPWPSLDRLPPGAGSGRACRYSTQYRYDHTVDRPPTGRLVHWPAKPEYTSPRGRWRRVSLRQRCL
jgi:hypothetical protein